MQTLRLLRVKHYIKNTLVFLPLFFAREITASALLWKTLLAFLAFCLLASAVYVFNDLRDADRDQNHPVKRLRPIASGAVTKRAAALLCAALLLGAAALTALAGGGLALWAAMVAYLALNVGYSLGLKHVPIADIVILAAGYLLRVMIGSAVTGIPISGWLYLTVIAVAFYLGLGKRRGEMLAHNVGGDARPVLKFYTPGFLEKNMLMCVTLGIVFYSLWTVDAATIARVGGEQLVWTVPLVIVIFFKYSMNLEGKTDGDPVEVLLGDKILLGLTALLAAALAVIVYF
jgi:4-hydroxybenzoate polyprenyltransferase